MMAITPFRNEIIMLFKFLVLKQSDILQILL